MHDRFPHAPEWRSKLKWATLTSNHLARNLLLPPRPEGVHSLNQKLKISHHEETAAPHLNIMHSLSFT